MTNKIYLGDTGTEIILDTGEDLTSATVMKILYKNKTTSGEWIATVVETTKLRYVTQTDDLDVSGVWKVQAYVEMPSWSGKGNTASFNVLTSFN